MANLTPHRTRQQTQGGCTRHFDPHTHQHIHLAQFDNQPDPALWPGHAANAVVDPNYGTTLYYHQLLRGPQGAQLLQGDANEIGCFAQWVLPDMPTQTNTMHFIPYLDLPTGQKATYLRIVAEYKPNKEEKYRFCFTVGGDHIEYPGKVSAPPRADYSLIALFWHPTHNLQCLMFKKISLNNCMDRFENMRILVWEIPPTILWPNTAAHAKWPCACGNL
jgi:hypothetical protein